MSLFSLLKTEQVQPSKRWGRRKQKQEEKNEVDLIKKKTEAESEKKRFFSFSWLSKLIPKSNSSSPKCPSCKPKHVANVPSPITNPVQNTKQQTPPRTSSHMSPLAPHRRSVGNSDRPRALPPRQRRHHSFGGESNLATSSVILGNVIPFSFMANDKENSSFVPVPVPDPTLFRHKTRRRLKNRPIVTAVDDDDDNTRRKSFSGRMKARKCRVRVYSPRQGPKDKLETMAKKFAVVKRSSEPERDFRESMVEMIREKGIGRSEELESLLACYLTLNSDEHHDVIVRVFRQIWYQINPERFVIGN